ncbi:MAG: hypothetical protein CR975_03470 [Gammaproteobacteria bacterium]|nr:MAG: hypothetical protein CR975_03470 [Gammaproteobacteria bacterium]
MKINQWVIGLALILTGCASSTGSLSGNNEGLAGVYYASLPCSACNGLVVDLLLGDNKTYSMLQRPKNGEAERYETGTWNKQGDKLSLTANVNNPRKLKQAKMVLRDFVIQEGNKLLLLDKNGKPYQQTKRYLFEKK